MANASAVLKKPFDHEQFQFTCGNSIQKRLHFPSSDSTPMVPPKNYIELGHFVNGYWLKLDREPETSREARPENGKKGGAS